MGSEQDFDRTFAIGERALGYIKYNLIPATPRSYELWYAYASGHNKSLVEAVQEILSSKSRLSAADAERLYDIFLSPNRMSEQVEVVGSQISAEISEIVNMLQTTAKTTGDFGKSLNEMTEGLSDASSPAQLKSIVEGLVTATADMANNSRDLEAQLEQSQSQIAELSDNLEAVRTESMTDQLTGIPNRKHFDQTLYTTMSDADHNQQPLCLMMADIDHFKKFNDTYGHLTGDQVLRLVSHTLKSNVKGRDLPARFGGEEFAVILPATELSDALVLAEQIRAAVMNKELIKKSTNKSLGRITVSIGISKYIIGESVEDFINRADTCLYSAKSAGRNVVKAENDPDVNLATDAA